MTIDTLQYPTLESMLKDPKSTQDYISLKLSMLEELGWQNWFFLEMDRESQVYPDDAYPSQGLAPTPYDGPRVAESKIQRIDSQIVKTEIIPAMLYYLELSNHPERMHYLDNTPAYKSPDYQFNLLFFLAKLLNNVISINELALRPQGTDLARVSRAERFAHGPFVRFNNQPRIVLVGSANPECWGSAPSIAHMAESHALVGLPRDGVFKNVKRQVDLAMKVFEWLDHSPVLIGRSKEVCKKLRFLWQKNVMGVLEVNPKKGLERAEALYDVGVRTFRPYSPEPGSDLVNFVKLLKQYQTAHNWDEIEVYPGQVVSTKQAKQLERLGANGLYVGIGGGGRCITSIRSGLAIDWPQLIWELRGKIRIPIIVEGGASDFIAQTLAVGGTGIGVTRKVAGGTIESPGGLLFYKDTRDRLFKPYGGEASARTKFNGGKSGPLNIIPYIEGETTGADYSFGVNHPYTLCGRLNQLNGDGILSLVFQNAGTIQEIQNKSARNIVKTDPAELQLRNSHDSII